MYKLRFSAPSTKSISDTLRRKSPPPEFGSGTLCWSAVGRSDLDVVTEFAKLFRQGSCTMDEKFWFGFGSLLDVAYSLMKNFPDQTAYPMSNRPDGRLITKPGEQTPED